METLLYVMENKCVYKAWVAPKSNTKSGTQEIIYNDLDVKYRFESCLNHYKQELNQVGHPIVFEIMILS